jgi:hypothetical protein
MAEPQIDWKNGVNVENVAANECNVKTKGCSV